MVGCLFFWPIVGIDPVPGRVGYPFRMLLVVLTLPFHAFLGVTIMGQDDAARRRLLPAAARRPDWAPGCPTRSTTSTSPAASSGRSGDLVGLVLFGVLFVQWVRSSMREAEREDRRLDLLEARARPRREHATAEPR